MTKPTSGLVTAEGAPDVCFLSGMPDDVRKQRVDRIYKLAKNAMQYVTAGIMKLVEIIVIRILPIYCLEHGTGNTHP